MTTSMISNSIEKMNGLSHLIMQLPNSTKDIVDFKQDFLEKIHKIILNFQDMQRLEGQGKRGILQVQINLPVTSIHYHLTNLLKELKEGPVSKSLFAISSLQIKSHLKQIESESCERN